MNGGQRKIGVRCSTVLVRSPLIALLQTQELIPPHGPWTGCCRKWIRWEQGKGEKNLPWLRLAQTFLSSCFTSVPVPFLHQLSTQLLPKTPNVKVLHWGDLYFKDLLMQWSPNSWGTASYLPEIGLLTRFMKSEITSLLLVLVLPRFSVCRL